MPAIKTKSGLQEYTVGEPTRLVTLASGESFSVVGSIAQSAVQAAYDKGQPIIPVVSPPSLKTDRELRLEDLRVKGDTDATLLKRGITQMQRLRIPLDLDGIEYNSNEFIPIGGDYCHIRGVKGGFSSGTRIKGSIAGFGRITSAVGNIMSFPTKSDPGPMNGCCFYFTSLIYDAIIENITFIDFRFANAYLESHNSPIFRNVYYYYCNAGTIAYQGCQNYQYINCSSQVLNTLHISSATCFPSGSPYAKQDNYYTDTLVVKNEDGYGSFGSMDINVHFDNFFRDSILRPAVDSVSIAKTTKYLDANNNLYPNDSDYCNPSGWGIFCPVRNERLLFNWNFRSLDFRGRMKRGFCLANYTVIEFLTDGTFSFELEGELKPVFTLGSNFHLLNLVPSRPTGAVGKMFHFTDRGTSSGFCESGGKYMIDINNVIRPAIPEKFNRQLVFDANKYIKDFSITSSQELEVAYPNSELHVVGNKITMSVTVTNGSKITFKAGQFEIISAGSINYSKPIHLELEYANPKVLVKIFNKVTSEEWEGSK